MRRAQAYASPGYGYTPLEAQTDSNGAKHELQDQNDSLTDELKYKINALKSLSIDIGTEVRAQNGFLSEMDDEFDKGDGILQSTMRRVVLLSKKGYNCHILYVVLFSFAALIFVWLVLKLR